MVVAGGQWLIGAGCDRGGQRMVEAVKMGQTLIFGQWSGAGGPASSWWSCITRLEVVIAENDFSGCGSCVVVVLVVRGGPQLLKTSARARFWWLWGGVRKRAPNSSEMEWSPLLLCKVA